MKILSLEPLKHNKWRAVIQTGFLWWKKRQVLVGTPYGSRAYMFKWERINGTMLFSNKLDSQVGHYEYCKRLKNTLAERVNDPLWQIKDSKPPSSF